MKLSLFVLLLTSFIFVHGEELQEKKLYVMGTVEIPQTCPAYPVSELIKAFKAGDVETAKKFCTAEYLDYAEKRTLGFAKVGLGDYKDNLNTKVPMRFRFFISSRSGFMVVKVMYEDKAGAGCSSVYRVKKFENIWKIIPTE